MVEQVNITDTKEPVFETVRITNHAVHGTFEIEVQQGMSDSEVIKELDNLDLDLLLGIGNIDKDIGETNVEKIKEFENSSGAGLRDNKWYGHDSLEGGTQTIAYGHKLTAEEVKQGFIEINGEQVDYRKGLTQDQAEVVLNKDAKWAETHAVASLKKVGLDGDEGKVEALTSLIYNVGSGAWGKSKAKQYLEAGQVEDFMHEAFSEEVGFVKVNGEKLRGLVRRRAAEAQLFASANIDEGGGFATMIQDALAAINPISSAAAAEVTPQTPLDSKPTTEITQLPTLKRNTKDTESVGTLQDMLGMDVGEDRGIFGPATEKAVKAFQKEQGLTTDGIVGKNTWAALQGSKPTQRKAVMVSAKNFKENKLDKPVIPHDPVTALNLEDEGEEGLNYDLPKMIMWGVLTNMGFDVEIDNSDLDPRTLAAASEAMGSKKSITNYKQFSPAIAKEQVKVYDANPSMVTQYATAAWNLLKSPGKLYDYMKDDKATAAFVLGRVNVDDKGNAVNERWNWNYQNKFGGAATPFTAGRAFLGKFMPESGEGPIMNINLSGEGKDSKQEETKTQ